jgi:DNA invertase Pin-like site-specific DNA recombinase
MALAFSYVRFSSAKQASGDSLTRQTELRDRWCRKHKVALDTSLTLRDLGVSAFRGKHRSNDQYALGQFLACVKSGRVPEGSYFIIESLDRLSREEIVPAVHLFTGILMAGVRVVQLIPQEVIYTAAADMTSIMLAIVELSRGHSESATKSERSLSAWSAKRKAAKAKPMTRRLPSWVTLEDGKLVLIPKKAQIVRALFRLAGQGRGLHAIAKKMNKAKVPVLARTEYKGKAVEWSKTVIYHVLRSRAAIGEFQARRGRGADREPVGEVLKGYFPRVVGDGDFYRVQTLIDARATIGRGQRGKRLGLFSGLLRDAHDGGCLTYKFIDPGFSSVIPSNAKRGTGAPWGSFPARPLEDAILSQLRELKASDIFPERAGAGSKAEELSAKLAELEAVMNRWRAKMDQPELIDEVADKLKEFAARKKALSAELAEANQQVASPLSESWGELRSCAGLLAADGGDELRERVRSALRRTVDGLWVLIRKGRPRVAAVQVWFKGKPARQRSCLIVYHQAQNNGLVSRPARTEVRSFASAAGGLDLRRPRDAQKLAKVLESIDPKEWAGDA